MKNKKKLEKPVVVSIDTLSIMDDDELFGLQKKLEKDRQFALSKNEDVACWDVELAYIAREFQIRQTRAEMHKKFVAETNDLSQDDYSYTSNEYSLDSPDLDNAEFVKLCAQRDALRELRESKKKKQKLVKGFN